jgi:hypothetical protein
MYFLGQENVHYWTKKYNASQRRKYGELFIVQCDKTNFWYARSQKN